MDSDSVGQFCALLTALTWAGAMVLFKLSGELMPPLVLNLFKNTVGLTLIIITLLAAGGRFTDLSGVSADDIRVLLLSGFLGIAVGDTIFLYSLNLVGVGIQSIVDCLYSPFVILFSWLMLSESLSTLDYCGVVTILMALLVCSRHEPPAGRSRRQLLYGIFLGSIAIATIALGIIIAKPVLDPSISDCPLLWASAIRLAAGTLPLAIWGLFSSKRSAYLSAFRPSRVWKSALPGSFLGAYLSMILWIAGFKYTKAGIAGVLNQTSTIFAIILAAMFLRERLTRRKIIAVLLVIVGVVLVTVDFDDV